MEPELPTVVMDNVLIVCEDLAAMTDFFKELGLEVEAETRVEGPWVERVIGVADPQSNIVVLRTPDGHNRIELSQFTRPVAMRSEPKDAPANALGIRRIMFRVEDIDATLARLQARGASLIGEVVNYEDVYKLCYLRGPEGIMLALAQRMA